MGLFLEGLWPLFEQHQSLVLLFCIAFVYYDTHLLKKSITGIEQRLAVLIKCPMHENIINNLVEKVNALEVEGVQQADQIETDIGEVVTTVNNIQVSIAKIDAILISLDRVNQQLTEIFSRISQMEQNVSKMQGTCRERGHHCPALRHIGNHNE